jgi:hypothetical protein
MIPVSISRIASWSSGVRPGERPLDPVGCSWHPRMIAEAGQVFAHPRHRFGGIDNPRRTRGPPSPRGAPRQGNGGRTAAFCNEPLSSPHRMPPSPSNRGGCMKLLFPPPGDRPKAPRGRRETSRDRRGLAGNPGESTGGLGSPPRSRQEPPSSLPALSNGPGGPSGSLPEVLNSRRMVPGGCPEPPRSLRASSSSRS